MSEEKNKTPDTPEEPYSGILGDYSEPGQEDAPAPDKKPKKEKKEKNNKKALTVAGISASVVLLGCLGFLGVRQFNANKPASAVETEHMKVSEQILTCYYQDIISSYIDYYGEDMLLSYYQMDVNLPLKDQMYPVNDGTTWFYQVMEQAKQQVSQQLMVAEAAKAAGYTLSEEQKQSVEEALAEIDFSTYGNDVTEDDVRNMLLLQAYSIGYYNEYVDSLTYTDEELDAFYAENEQDFQTCSIACFSVSYEEEDADADSEDADAESEDSDAEDADTDSEDTDAGPEDSDAEDADTDSEDTDAGSEDPDAEDADTDSEDTDAESEDPDAEDADTESEDIDIITKATANAFVDALTAAKTSQAFEKQVGEILTRYYDYEEEDLGDILPTLYNNSYSYTAGDELSEWAFGEAQVGDTYVIENGTTYYVYMLAGEPGRDESNTINVRHILFATSEHLGEDGDEETALAECRTLAESCLTEWEGGEMTEDSFAALATAYTEDPGSQSSGGLYEYVYEGQMVPTFNDWCFDASRQPGDTGIVETSYGVHVMYFVSDAGPIWKAEITSTLMQESVDAWFTELEELYPVTFDDEVINSIEG